MAECCEYDQGTVRNHEKCVRVLGQLSMLNQLKGMGLLRDDEYEKVRKMIMQELEFMR